VQQEMQTWQLPKVAGKILCGCLKVVEKSWNFFSQESGHPELSIASALVAKTFRVLVVNRQPLSSS